MSKISLKHSGGNVVSLNSPTSAPTSADVAFKLPNADGTSGQVLKTDGSGNLSFGADTSGKILQVVQTFKTDGTSQAGNSSSTYYDISGMSVTITPSSSSNKILVNWVAQVNSNATDRNNSIRLLRDSTVIGNSTAGSSQNAQTDHRTTNDTNCHPFTMMFLDTPNTTSAVTYKLQWAIEGSGGSSTNYYLNRDAHAGQGAVSHITVMEVAA